MRQPNHITRFAAREDGAGTVFSLFIFVILCVLLGIMVDATNAWRNKTMLAAAADMGSHAGAVTLAYDGTEEEAVAAARLQVRKNLPQNLFGDLSEREGDVFLLHYDTATRQLYDNGPRNAVAVRTNQLSERNNAVGTFLLSFAGIFSWDVDEVSVTVFDVSSECLGTDGIYSEEQIRVAAGSHFGTGYCLHSNDRVWLPQTISFDSDTQVSMPDLDDCGNKCYPDANPGIVAKEFPMVLHPFDL